MALTFVNPVEMDYLRMIENEKKKTISALRPPLKKEVQKSREKEIFNKIEQWKSENKNTHTFETAERLLEQGEAKEVVAAILNEFLFSRNEDSIQLSFEKPLTRKGGQRRGKGQGGGKKPFRKGRTQGSQGGRNHKRQGGGNRQPQGGQKRSQGGRTFKDHIK